ncbi:cyclin-dependent kinase 4 inhibitor C [Cheilinus undulatus]|uniref:cyclin-dependent kinase 4 inhibitor C n=1 Tax=Cheilinus undulatus TaxID=241271 RepID=UPI001BD3B8D4|nr:cyclin-dependent kinase 4 inhibitor C [Cheilinus undulatus]XP_041647765.1 cyclin-dependent kinase 4 inhibitor C [Cheilinus undulatus]
MAEVSVADKLCNACASGNTADVLFLIENGADVNGLNSFNRTPIQVVKLGKPSLVEVLLEAGADPNMPDPVLNLTVTHDAARDGHKDTVRVLLDYGANPNMVDDRGNLPLHLAAMGGHLELTQLLIGCTLDPQTRNGQGYTAAELAQHHGKTDVFSFIQHYLGAH